MVILPESDCIALRDGAVSKLDRDAIKRFARKPGPHKLGQGDIGRP
jgi:hypothetical protein